MEVKIIHRTVDLLGNTEGGKVMDDMKVIGGREAGICYMADNYFSESIKNTAVADKRANAVISSGHHSPFDHASIGIEISGIPKILAMLLNSTEFYTTSEKSARYTVMKAETEEEQRLYDKWRKIFTDEINKLGYTDLNDKAVDKLAIENARYMLSVFTPTSMGYTTTFRQFCYMTAWTKRLIEDLKMNPNRFNSRLLPYCEELYTKLFELTGGIIPDIKGGKFRFMVEQRGYSLSDRSEFIADQYQITYLASFAQLAQEQRHRTEHYEMGFDGTPGKYGCYCPELIRFTELEEEWIEDFNSIAHLYPQATLVNVLESGDAYWFFMKAKERMCGRAQLEICRQTEDTMKRFISNRSELCREYQDMLDGCTKNGKPCTKCQMEGIKCTEVCRWGANGLDRKI